MLQSELPYLYWQDVPEPAMHSLALASILSDREKSKHRQLLCPCCTASSSVSWVSLLAPMGAVHVIEVHGAPTQPGHCHGRRQLQLHPPMVSLST